MSEVTELTKTREAARARMQHLQAQASSLAGRGKVRKLSEEEIKKCDALYDQFETATVDFENAERDLRAAEDFDAQHDPANSRGRVVPPLGVQSSSASQEIQLTGGPKFANMFPGAARQSVSAPFKTFEAFALAVYRSDPRLHEISNAASGASEGVGGDGGFFVPIPQYANLMDSSLQIESIRPGATIIPMTSSSISIPMFDLSNRSTGIATMEGKSTSEGVTGTTQKPKVREMLLTANKIQILVPTTIELLQDAPQVFTALLQQNMIAALGQTLDAWFFNGTGVGCPLGVMNAPALVSVAKDASQVAATITPTNIGGMVSRLAPGSWSRAVWIVSPSGLSQLFNLTTVIKTVSGAENVGGFGPQWFQVLPDGTFSLLGRPLIVSDRCQALGTKGDIMLVDRQAYLIGLRETATLAIDSSIGFKESEIWYRLNCRIAGQPALAAPITPRVGSATLSPFVTLDTRA